MGRRPVTPTVLTTRDFTIEEARRAGLSRRQLEGSSWRRISHGRYAWAGLAEGPELFLASVQQRLPEGAAFSGRTAAWLHGLDFAPSDPIEVTIPRACRISAMAGVVVSQATLPGRDLTVRRGLSATSPLRTVFDLARRQPLVEAVVAVDLALHDRLVGVPDLCRFAAERGRCRGIRQFRRVIELAEPAAESPMETRLRMQLVLAGLPRPEAQVSLHDDHGHFLGRADLYYPTHRLAIEYDGGTHRNTLIEDNRRQNRLLNAGYHLLRFTGADIRETPAALLAQVKQALAPTPGAARRQRAK